MTDKYAVIGNPIAHSKSPQIHRMFAEQTGQDISYEAILAPLDGFAAIIERLCNEGYKGCNVTVPFKEEAFNLTKSRSKRYVSIPARLAMTGNTLKFSNNTVCGLYNTDGIGLVRDIKKNRGFDLKQKRVLLMGSGGAAWGVVMPLLKERIRLEIANRTVDTAQNKANRFAKFSGGLDAYMKRRIYANYALQYGLPVTGYSNLGDKQFDLVINATPTGLSNEMPPLPPGIFAPGALAYDMMYGRETPFMRFAHEHGAQVANGLGMLVEQAAESFYIWRGVRPDTAPVIAALRG
jgi:shikimate dehydrogenase